MGLVIISPTCVCAWILNYLKMVEEVKKKEEIDMDNFDWVALQKELRTSASTGMAYEETNKDKLWRKMGENPLIPTGAAVTCGVLAVGIFSFATKRAKLSQIMMRARVVHKDLLLLVWLGRFYIKLHKENQSDELYPF